MFVSTRTRTLLSLLLLMVTLQPYHLLPTKQSSLVPSLRNQMQTGSNLAINTTANHTLGISWAAQMCLDWISQHDYTRTEGRRCRAYQVPWLDLLLEKGVHRDDTEYECKDLYHNIYCNVLVARAYCYDRYFKAVLEVAQQEYDDDAQACNRSTWTSWLFPLESIPMITAETVECEDILNATDTEAACAKEVRDLTELACKKTYEFEKCKIEHSCKNCAPKQANYFLDYVGEIWSPKLVECTKWAREEPKLVCPVASTTKSPVTSPEPSTTVPSTTVSSTPNPSTHIPSTSISSTAVPSTPVPSTPVPSRPVSSTPLSSMPVSITSVPSKTLNPVLATCELVLLEKGEPAHCLAEAKIEYPNPSGYYVRNWCKGTYYAIDCVLKAACKYCSTDTKDAAIDEARKGVDLIREQCEIWSKDEPKLECSTTSSMSTLMIVGIVFAVIVILAVIIAPHVIVYYMCCTSSSGGGGSRNPAITTQAKQDYRLEQSSRAVPALKAPEIQDSPTERSSKGVSTFPPTLTNQVPRSYGSTRLVQAHPTLSKPRSSVEAKQLSHA